MHRDVTAVLDRMASAYDRNWALDVAGSPKARSWPMTVNVKTAEGESADIGAMSARQRELEAWAEGNGLGHEPSPDLFARGCYVGPRLPKITVPSLDACAAALGRKGRLDSARAFRDELLGLVPGIDRDALLRLAKACDGALSDDVVRRQYLDCLGWLLSNDWENLTSRQCAIPGVHAKWLDQDSLRTLLRLALGKEPPTRTRPSWFHITYLDPGHGGSLHGAWCEGDQRFRLEYEPSFLLVCENHDIANTIPAAFPGGVCVCGSGNSTVALADAPFVRAAETVLYWGDMDQDGYEILDRLRSRGVPCRSVLMGPVDYGRFQEGRGTRRDRNNEPIRPHESLPCPTLTDGERSVYELLADPANEGSLRIEQEHIDIVNEAVPAIRAALAAVGLGSEPFDS